MTHFEILDVLDFNILVIFFGRDKLSQQLYVCAQCLKKKY